MKLNTKKYALLNKNKLTHGTLKKGAMIINSALGCFVTHGRFIFKTIIVLESGYIIR